MKKSFLKVFMVLALIGLLAFAVVGCQKAVEPTATEPTGATSQESTAPEPDRAALLVTADELKADSDSYFVWDCRAEDAYKAGHIPGAINLPWQPLTTAAKGAAGDPDWGTLLPPADMKKVLDAAGIDTSKTIVLYSDPTGWGEDGRIMWSLASVGITNTRLLDGGFPYWQAAGNEVSTEAVVLNPTDVTVSDTLDASLNATTDEVAAGYQTIPLVDMRAKSEYEGATDYGEKRGGHVPGAKNVEFPSLFADDGTLKPAAELDALFSDAGAVKDGDTIFYCTKGIRSGYATMVARWLGYTQARNWDASFYAWAGNPDLPVEK